MPAETLPISLIIATRDRPEALSRTLTSLSLQSAKPAEVVIVDSSNDSRTRALCAGPIPGFGSNLIWKLAKITGAASQRNEGIQFSSSQIVGFMDDDVLLDKGCFWHLWLALQSDSRIGGVSAMITNQSYQNPGRISRLVFRFMLGSDEKSYAGRILGPAVNLLPEDRDDLPDVVPVEWLNTTCTLYRREALPSPPFPRLFTGYSLMEDVCLSLVVGTAWKLANARLARIYHDSQPGSHKSNRRELAGMELTNRHFIMTEVLRRKSLSDYVKLTFYELFCLASLLQAKATLRFFGSSLLGKIEATYRIASSRI